ncbi:hypothetical protein J4G33_03110 [Actinotalea sp. BY-33]|uniref:WXG100 family type VII secretion target n=1 Tax=Actinotalea soli TaxID=2819234 RepID=A0A939LPX7_9CELL|nr:hypothetical protein [Actinotalea soli]MBO1750785.1 hypothetical protein [Actinotalea soli]
MAGTFLGADPAALRTQALALHRAGDALSSSAHHVSQGLDSLAWHGADATAAREAWRSCFAPILLRCAAALQEGCIRLLDEADHQDGASTGTAPGGMTWDQVRGTAASAHEVVNAALGRLGDVGTVADLVALHAATSRWSNVTLGAPAAVLNQGLEIMQQAQVGPALRHGLTGVAVLGVGSDALMAHRRHSEGDLTGMVDHGASAILGTVGLAPAYSAHGLLLGASWQVGWTVGSHASEAMDGTSFGDRFTERMEPAFQMGGAWGMLNTPGALMVTGAEEVGLRARDTWRWVTGSGTGTLDDGR